LVLIESRMLTEFLSYQGVHLPAPECYEEATDFLHKLHCFEANITKEFCYYSASKTEE
jgi:hypothetical protein